MGQEYSLLGLVTLEPGSWADWFSGSMSALAVVVALSSFPVSNWQKRREDKQRERDVGRAIGYKIVTLLSRNSDIDRHIKESLVGRKARYPAGMRFSLVPPLSLSERRPSELNQNEIDLLLKSNSADLLMEIELCYARFSSIALAMNEYAAKNDALYELLPVPIANDGATFTHKVSEIEHARARPYMLMLESLLESMEKLLSDNVERLNHCLEQYGKDMERYFGKALLEFEPANAV